MEGVLRLASPGHRLSVLTLNHSTDILSNTRVVYNNADRRNNSKFQIKDSQLRLGDNPRLIPNVPGQDLYFSLTTNGRDEGIVCVWLCVRPYVVLF